MTAMIMDGQTVQVRNVETIAQNKGRLISVSYEQRRRDGDQEQLKREIYENGNSAVILPYDADRQTVLLTRQPRIPVFLQDGSEQAVEACAGKLDGENAERRIVKEMQEELGYKITKVQRLFELYVSPAAIMEKIVFFTCTYSPADKVSDGGGLKKEGEDIEVLEIPLHEAAATITAGEIVRRKDKDGRAHPVFEQSGIGLMLGASSNDSRRLIKAKTAWYGGL